MEVNSPTKQPKNVCLAVSFFSDIVKHKKNLEKAFMNLTFYLLIVRSIRFGI